MGRRRAAQMVVALVMAAALSRWLPAEHGFGRGDILAALELDGQISEAGKNDARVARARDGQCRNGRGRWARWLDITGQIQDRAGPGATVLLRDVNRNEGWFLRYDLYPVAAIGNATVPKEEPVPRDVVAVLVGSHPPTLQWVR